MSKISVVALFTENDGVPKTGLTLSDINMYLTARNRTTGVQTVIWSGVEHPSIEIQNIGAYLREYASADESTYDYYGRAAYVGVSVLDAVDSTGHVRQSELAKNVDDFQSEVLTQTTLAARLHQIWARWFNLAVQTATDQKLYKADSVTILGQTSVSDDGITQVRGKLS